MAQERLTFCCMLTSKAFLIKFVGMAMAEAIIFLNTFRHQQASVLGILSNPRVLVTVIAASFLIQLFAI